MIIAFSISGVSMLLQIMIIGTLILLENRSPGHTVGWLCILGLIPVLGFIFFLIFGQKTQGKLFRYKHIPNNRLIIMAHSQINNYNRNIPHQIDSHNKLVGLLLNSGSAPMTLHNQVEILLNGDQKFQALFNALEEAKHHIHLSYFIFKDDEIGGDIFKILARKVAEGVEVRVLLDGM
jgi:cardiolipin synthase